MSSPVAYIRPTSAVHPPGLAWRARAGVGWVGAQITETLLRDQAHGGPNDQLQTVAGQLATFVSAVTTSISIAIYDFRLCDPDATSTVVDALIQAADRGVSVRIGYDAGKPINGTAADFARLESDPAPLGTADWVVGHFDGTAVQTRPITAGSHLMHSKSRPNGPDRPAVAKDPSGRVRARPLAAGVGEAVAQGVHLVLPDERAQLHALKVMIIDDAVITGSYNFSANAERNAENLIHCDDPTTVAAYTDYLSAISAAYPGPSTT